LLTARQVIKEELMPPYAPAACAALITITVAMSPISPQAAPLQVTQIAPPCNSLAEPTAAVVVDFDKPLNPASVSPTTFRVFGKATGTKSGTLLLSNGDRRITFQPNEPFSAGEGVRVNLSHDLAATDLTTLRSAGYSFQFQIRTLPSGTFQLIDVLSNRIAEAQTRIYGAIAADLNHDRYLDLSTINQVSADVRVCLNRADGSGLYQPFLAPAAIGADASPNDRADFDGDGHTDLCVSARGDNRVWVLLGAGDGTFSATQSIPVGNGPRGTVALDVDGDGDADIVNANRGSNDLTLLVNDGSGVFGPASTFEGGVNGEYGLAAADMNDDGIADLVVGGHGAAEIRVQLGNGDGTFTPAGPSQPCGGAVWVIALEDLNGDGNLDASVANSTSNNNAILLGNGAGAFGPPVTIPTGYHATSTDLGDLDGDGDADLVVSSFYGGYWRSYRNDGAGSFTFHEQFTATANPSCAVLYDSDNDGDLDMALTDEIADQILLMRNAGVAGVEPISPPGGLTLVPNAPNPFREATEFRFVLERPSEVRVDVFDIGGRRVAGAGPMYRAAGLQSVRFDGRGRAGTRLRPGLYLYRVTAGSVVATGRMVLARYAAPDPRE
jgi:hypothetical protein